MKINELHAELASHPSGTFLELVEFNGKHFGACDIEGVSPVWEMHPDTDEFFYIVEGEFEITLLSGEEPEHHTAGAGSVFVVPKGIWHKPAAPRGAKFIYYTPGVSLHSELDDPRQSAEH